MCVWRSCGSAPHTDDIFSTRKGSALSPASLRPAQASALQALQASAHGVNRQIPCSQNTVGLLGQYTFVPQRRCSRLSDTVVTVRRVGIYEYGCTTTGDDATDVTTGDYSPLHWTLQRDRYTRPISNSSVHPFCAHHTPLSNIESMCLQLDVSSWIILIISPFLIYVLKSRLHLLLYLPNILSLFRILLHRYSHPFPHRGHRTNRIVLIPVSYTHLTLPTILLV